jgi:hypothetical protein
MYNIYKNVFIYRKKKVCRQKKKDKEREREREKVPRLSINRKQTNQLIA